MTAKLEQALESIEQRLEDLHQALRNLAQEDRNGGDLVSDDKLVELTGYKRASEQNEYLRRMGLVPFRGRNGRPRVTWEAVNQVMAGRRAKDRVSTEPDWSALER